MEDATIDVPKPGEHVSSMYHRMSSMKYSSVEV